MGPCPAFPSKPRRVAGGLLVGFGLIGGLAHAQPAPDAPTPVSSPAPPSDRPTQRERPAFGVPPWGTSPSPNRSPSPAPSPSPRPAPNPSPNPSPVRSPFVVSGYVQIDALPYSQRSQDELHPTTGEPLNEERVFVRRARLHGALTRGPISASLELDGNSITSPAARLISAEVAWQWPCDTPSPLVRVGLGLSKIPFGAELPSKTSARGFLEETAQTRALFPGDYDGALGVSGTWRLLRYAISATDGAPSGDKQFAARDPSSSYDLVGRVGVDVQVAEPVRIVAGFSALSGQGLHPGTQATKDQLVWVDANEDGLVQTTELQVIAGQPATPSVPFDRSAVGADLAVHYEVPWFGHGSVTGELVSAVNLDRALQIADPVTAGRDARELGASLAWAQAITPAARIGIRFDRYDPDRDARAQLGPALVQADTAIATWSFVAAWRFAHADYLALGFDHEHNAFGRATDGMPTTLAADRMTLRGQVEF